MHVTVIGGGVIGYAVAHELAVRGATVEVVDMRGPGSGATRASAGMLAPRLEGHSEPLLQLGLASLDRYDAFVAAVGAHSGLAIDYQRNGIVDRRRDVTVPGHGYVKVPDLMAALQRAAAARGVHVSTRRVDALARGDADAVVVAAGAWSGLFPAVPVKPIRGQIVQLRPQQRIGAQVIWGDDVYLVPWADGSVLAGATSDDAGFDESVSDAATARLRQAAARMAPALEGAVLEDVRVGLRPATPDELPLIGPSSTMRGVFYATGHYRNGVLLAPLTADLVADLVLDTRSAPLLDLTRPARFGL